MEWGRCFSSASSPPPIFEEKMLSLSLWLNIPHLVLDCLLVFHSPQSQSWNLFHFQMQFYQINLPGEKKLIKSTDTVSTNNSSIGAVQCKSMQRKIFIWFICSLFQMLQEIDLIYFLFVALFLYYCINNAEER